MLLGEKEECVDNRAAKAFHNSSSSDIKQMIEFKDFRHELHKEPNKEELWVRVLQFIG